MVHTIALRLLTSWEHSFALCFLWLIPAGNYSCPLSNSFPLLNYLHIFGIALSLCTKNILNYSSYFQVLSTYYVVDIFKVWKMSSQYSNQSWFHNGENGEWTKRKHILTWVLILYHMYSILLSFIDIHVWSTSNFKCFGDIEFEQLTIIVEIVFYSKTYLMFVEKYSMM